MKASIFLALTLMVFLESCTNYKAVVPEVVNEVRMSFTTDPLTTYDHPAQMSTAELSAILRGVRVEFRTNWLQG